MTTLTPGVLLDNRYRIQAVVGEGGFGRVYRAIHEQLNKTVAIKELTLTNVAATTHPDAQELFQREAKLLSQLAHPNLPRVDNYFTHNDINYLVMDFIEGQHLGDYAATYPYQRIPEAEVLTLIRPVLDALHYLHTQNPPIVHRDVKPNNIIRTPEGNIYLVDFGLAKRDHGQRQNIATAGFASAGYSAPEQYTQQVDPRADLYSVGATLYTLLSGEIPPSATDRSLERVTTADNTDPLDALDTTLSYVSTSTRDVVKRLLSLDPNQRYQTAKEVKKAVSTEPLPSNPQLPDSLPSGRAIQLPRPAILALVAGIVFLLSSVGFAANRWIETRAEQTTATAVALQNQQQTSTAESVRSTAEKETEIAADQSATAFSIAATQTAVAQQGTELALNAVALQETATAQAQQEQATAEAETATAIARGNMNTAVAEAQAVAATSMAIAATQTAEADRERENATATSIAATQTAEAEAEAANIAVSQTAEALRSALGLPVMIEIPAGTFLMGRGNADVEGRDHDLERPAHELNLPAFSIAETETTNAQFRTFIARGGYDRREYWTDAGWAWRAAENIREPRCWGDPQLRGDNQPVSCVSWYEAMAYVAWLRSETGDNYTLPTEAQWERAARGTEGRIYPWGNDPPASDRANYGNALETPRSVRSYPNGATRDGIFDMAGNVWEMTRSVYCRDGTTKDSCAATVYRYPYDPNDGRESLPNATQRIALRGGSFDNAAGVLPAYTRDPFALTEVAKQVGFRIVRTP